MTSIGTCPNCQGEVKLYQETGIDGEIIHRGTCWNCGRQITEFTRPYDEDDYESEHIRQHPKDWFFVWLPKEGKFGLYRLLGDGESESEAMGKALYRMERAGWEMDGEKWKFEDLLLRQNHRTVERTIKNDWVLKHWTMLIRSNDGYRDGYFVTHRFYVQNIELALHIFQRDYARDKHNAYQIQNEEGWVEYASYPVTVKEVRE